MSMSLYLWKAPLVDDEDGAAALVALEDESVFEASPDLERFFSELLDRYPAPETLVQEALKDETPWADSPEASDRLVSLSVRWSASGEDLDAIIELARSYDLVIYDPQGPSLHSHEAVDDYMPGFGELARGAAVLAVGVLVVLVAWKLSIPILTWILVFVGGFVALVAIVGLIATMQARLRPARR